MEISTYSADDDAPEHTHTHAVIRCCVMILQEFFFPFNPNAVRETFINLSVSEDERQSLSGIRAGDS